MYDGGCTVESRVQVGAFRYTRERPFGCGKVCGTGQDVRLTGDPATTFWYGLSGPHARGGHAWREVL